MALTRSKRKPARNSEPMTKLEQVQVLMNAFRMERIVYIILTTISAISLITIGIYFSSNQGNMNALLAMLAPTGTLTLCIFRVLKMWDDALKFITNSTPEDDEQ